MLGLAIHLILFNTWHLYGSLAIPEHSIAAPPDANGTTTTCTIQGFGLQLSYSVSFYYVCLSLYSFLTLRHNFESSKYQWAEKWMHLGVHLFPLTSAIWLLRLQAYNFAGNGVVCWIDSIPHGCGDSTNVPCVRGPQNITVVAALTAALPTFFVLLFPTIVMVCAYCYVKRHQRMITRIESKTVAVQAALYLCALYWSYFFTMMSTSFRLIADQHVYILAVLSTVNLNLLGLYILLIYLYFRRPRPSMSRAPAQLSPRRGKQRQQQQHDKTTGSSCGANTSFTIFDGSNPTGQFAEFIFDGDSEDDAVDAQESAMWADIQEHV